MNFFTYSLLFFYEFMTRCNFNCVRSLLVVKFVFKRERLKDEWFIPLKQHNEEVCL